MKKICKCVKEGHCAKNEKFLELIREPKYFCGTCGRMANRKKALCDPQNV